MNLPKRKQNRIKNFDYGQNGAYFITICTKDRRKILCEIVGEGSPLPHLSGYGKIVDKWIKRLPEKYPEISVDCYVIMPDHIHLLLSLEKDDGRGNPSPTVKTAMGWFKYQATKEINASRASVGEKIFQRSFYDHVIRNTQDYIETVNYINNNPIKLKGGI